MGLIVVALLLCQRRRKHSKQSARTGQESLTTNNSSLVRKYDDTLLREEKLPSINYVSVVKKFESVTFIHRFSCAVDINVLIVSRHPISPRAGFNVFF